MQTKTLNENDLELFFSYAKKENWDIEEIHIRTLLKTNPDDFFIFHKDDEILGYVVALKESEKLGFISSLLVVEKFRAQGYGKKILSFALEYLGERQIALDSVVGQEDFYKKFGFTAYFDVNNYRFEVGTLSIKNNTLEVIDFDEHLSLENQNSYLQELLVDKNIHYKAILQEGKISSFAFAFAYKDGYKISLYTEDINHAATLLFALCEDYEKKSFIYLRTSQTDSLLEALAQALDMQKVEHFTRMYNKIL